MGEREDYSTQVTVFQLASKTYSREVLMNVYVRALSAVSPPLSMAVPAAFWTPLPPVALLALERYRSFHSRRPSRS